MTGQGKTSAVRRLAPGGLAALLGGAGVLHLVAPAPFATIVPPQLGDPRPWVLWSGVAELAVAAALLPAATRRYAGWAAAGLLVAVFPANVQMALDGGATGVDGVLGSSAVAWARLPLQVPLVAWAVYVARGPVSPGRGRSTYQATTYDGSRR